MIAVPLGLGDLAIGLVYMFGLPKEHGVSHRSCSMIGRTDDVFLPP